MVDDSFPVLQPFSTEPKDGNPIGFKTEMVSIPFFLHLKI